MSMTDSRSYNGCWTCRARRKKCDENGEPCLTCASWQLPCHGYGPRPHWMHGGLSEKAQIAEFKAIVKRNIKYKRRSGGQRKKDAVDVFLLNNSTEPSDKVSDPSVGIPPPQSLLLQSPTPGIVQYNQPQLSLLTPSPENTTCLSKSIASPWESTTSPWESTTSRSESTTSLPESELYDDMLLSSVSLDQIDIDLFKTPSLLLDSDLEALLNSSASSAFADPPILNPLSNSNSLYLRELNPHQALAPRSFVDQLAPSELSALHYYFKTIFPFQYPFLSPFKVQVICNELFNLAGNSKYCISSMLSQGIFGQQFELFKLGLRKNEDFLESVVSYEQISVKGLHNSLQNLNTAPREDSETCRDIKQVETQVSAAQVMLSKMLRRDSTWPELQKVFASFNPIDLTQFSNEEQTVIQFSQNTLICLDILSCASTGMEPSFALKFRDKFRARELTLRLNEIIGCEDSVMECIMEIAVLHHWKKKGMTNGSLSLIELAKQALPLERNLQEIRKIALDRNNNLSALNISIGDTSILTNVFACAAFIYLHVIVSGPRPEIPEIKLGVTNTIEAITLLPNARLLRRLMWPVCVAACLADTDDIVFFEQLERGLVEQFGRYQSILRAFDIARECWKLRRCDTSKRRAFDWTDAMASIGDMVLLLF